MAIASATLLGLIHHFWRSDAIGSLAIWLGAVSLWVLDWITHRPDMPLSPRAYGRYGLGLWNSIPGTMVVEIAMFGIGVWPYVRATRPQDLDRPSRHTCLDELMSAPNRMSSPVRAAKRQHYKNGTISTTAALARPRSALWVTDRASPIFPGADGREQDLVFPERDCRLAYIGNVVAHHEKCPDNVPCLDLGYV